MAKHEYDVPSLYIYIKLYKTLYITNVRAYQSPKGISHHFFCSEKPALNYNISNLKHGKINNIKSHLNITSCDLLHANEGINKKCEYFPAETASD